MWDVQIVSRTLDRKQNEAVVFAIMLKNSPDAVAGCGILSAILDDIRFCSEIIAKGNSDMRTSPITDAAYTDRLSDAEKSDEAYLDSVRITPVEGSTMEAIIEDLEARNQHLQDTLDTVMYELKVTKERNAELSLDLDYANAEKKADDTDYFGIEDKAEDEVEVEETEVTESVPAESEPAEEAVSEDVAEDPTPASEPVEEITQESIDQEIKTLEQIPDDPMNFTEIDKIAAKRVMLMKEAKMDYFIDLSLKGRNVKACDDIVSFLKVDYKLCEIILNMDIGNEEDVIRCLNEMLDLVDSEYKSPYQKFYVKNLAPQEKVYETMFNGLMEKVQRIMFAKLPIIGA